ncbi:hypothetical protein QSV34_10860 [Porticoccus sp. W117]|uniref:hypothetical protein n=1 Tax=Porticoccus sp. W117 TaxID=3054777 RepID=UPI002595AC6E|nr:hypothetical protein [Porticoccus sp. W117]MDM3871850.1 hypothetical protein [Porticoccus sp. W117]
MNNHRIDTLKSSLDSIKAQLDSYQMHRKNLKVKFEDIGVRDFDNDEGRIREDSIEAFYDSLSKDDGSKRLLHSYVNSLETLRENVHHFLNKEPLADKKVENRETRLYWGHQRKVWLTWVQQTTRWIIGAIIVIFIYSGGVWMSEKYPNFFHMPVHDWFKSISNN